MKRAGYAVAALQAVTLAILVTAWVRGDESTRDLALFASLFLLILLGLIESRMRKNTK